MGDSEILIKVVYIHEQLTEEKEFFIDVEEITRFSDFLNIISKQFKIKITTVEYSIKTQYCDIWIDLIDLSSLFYFFSSNLTLDEQIVITVSKKKKVNEFNYGEEDELTTNNISNPVYDANGN